MRNACTSVDRSEAFTALADSETSHETPLGQLIDVCTIIANLWYSEDQGAMPHDLRVPSAALFDSIPHDSRSSRRVSVLPKFPRNIALTGLVAFQAEASS